jgi:hypothetical protein
MFLRLDPGSGDWLVLGLVESSVEETRVEDAGGNEAPGCEYHGRKQLRKESMIGADARMGHVGGPIGCH